MMSVRQSLPKMTTFLKHTRELILTLKKLSDFQSNVGTQPHLRILSRRARSLMVFRNQRIAKRSLLNMVKNQPQVQLQNVSVLSFPILRSIRPKKVLGCQSTHSRLMTTLRKARSLTMKAIVSCKSLLSKIAKQDLLRLDLDQDW